ncbi:unnamed protein product [Lepeophtheirus salmonis]|uniref:(salmon louse) hypothetical protein n=1 Tax=Lepeophtheirus salmonis TaxID=72036 RepID=A0A7R8CUC9_LEPSM|nr:unnamed protein product [Lepeophtheirus salmonis]CAF2935552.1 unnamed protein product [Lepeophtheirus salmonis]
MKEQLNAYDRASCHGAVKTQAFLRDNFLDYWELNMWLHSSPDANCLDYSIQARPEKTVCATSQRIVHSLEASVKKKLTKLESNYIVKVCKEFRPCIEAIIITQGSHID